MNLTDIIALAKQGYKPSDIRELIAISNETEKTPEAETPASSSDPVIPETPEKEAETVTKEITQPAPAISAEQVKEMEKKIEALQEENRRRDISGDIPDPQLQVNDMVAGFM